ncbi:DUF559 domain-containing protein [Microbacterium sp. NPDC089189]|uniref:endonuclease domain-containing protein n=1 Tax=Microbacterium sp. NPDC089189 TaxID=3154972 RepID=UPI00341D7BED
MELRTWLEAQGAIAHRDAAAAAGFSREHVRAGIRSGQVHRIRRSWIATDAAPPDLVTAAAASAHLACLSSARRRGWWLPPDLPEVVHLHLAPHASSAGLPPDAVPHWSEPLAPPARHSLLESVEDSLRHIAHCLPPEATRVVWESAVRVERIDPDALRRVRWRSPAASACAAEVRGLSDSGIETLFVVRLSHWGLPLVQQAVVAGRRVDLLIGELLVVQIDGFAHHRGAAQRGADVAHDAELRLRGYTVLRFTYAQIVYDWPTVERAVARAIAAGLHRRR